MMVYEVVRLSPRRTRSSDLEGTYLCHRYQLVILFYVPLAFDRLIEYILTQADIEKTT